MKVKDVMSADSIKHCTTETKLANVSKIMKDSNVGALPVIDHDKKVIGIVTDRDLCLTFSHKTNKTASEICVKDLHLSGIHTVKEEESVKEALGEMRKNKIGRLPVVDKDGKLKGMLSINNLLSHALTEGEGLGQPSSKEENLAKTIIALLDRNCATVKKEKPEEMMA